MTTSSRRRLPSLPIWILAALAAQASVPAAQGADTHARPAAGLEARAFRASYFYVDPLTEAELRVANPTGDSLDLTLRARLWGEVPVALGALVVPPYGDARVPLRGALGLPSASDLGLSDPSGLAVSWGDGSRPWSVWGSLEVEGDVDTVVACLLSTDSTEGLMLGQPVAPDRDLAHELHALWWRPTPAAQVRFVLQNASALPVDVYPAFLVDGVRVEGAQPLRLGARAAALVPLRDVLPAGVTPERAQAAIFTVAGGREALRGTTTVVDEAARYSAGHRMEGARTVRERHLVGLPFGSPEPSFGFPATTVLSPRVVLGNASASRPLEASLRLAASGAEDPPSARIALAPLEVRVIDLLELFGSAGSATEPIEGYAGVVLTEETPPQGDLAATAVSVNTNADQPFEYSAGASFADAPPAAGARVLRVMDSFSLEGAFDSHLVFRNASDEPATYSYSLEYLDDGSPLDWASEDLVLRPRETVVVDLRKLRDGGVPDRHGSVLPPDVVAGHVRQIVHSDVLSSIVVFDPVHGTCSPVEVGWEMDRIEIDE